MRDVHHICLHQAQGSSTNTSSIVWHDTPVCCWLEARDLLKAEPKTKPLLFVHGHTDHAEVVRQDTKRHVAEVCNKLQRLLYHQAHAG